MPDRSVYRRSRQTRKPQLLGTRRHSLVLLVGLAIVRFIAAPPTRLDGYYTQLSGIAAHRAGSSTSVPYSDVIIGRFVFQARKQNIQAIGKITDDMRLDRQDILNLVMIFGPILLILALLLTKKEAVGCGLFGELMGKVGAGDAGSAGWYAVMLLLGLLFVDPEVRARPKKIIDALSNAGILISTLYLMFLAVSIIDFCLKFTGLPTFLSLDVLGWLQALGLGQGGSVAFQLLALMLTLLGMGIHQRRMDLVANFTASHRRRLQ